MALLAAACSPLEPDDKLRIGTLQQNLLNPESTAIALDQRVVSGLSRRGVVFLDLNTGQDVAFIDITGAVNNSSAEVQITQDGTRALVVSRGDGSTTAFGYYATIDLTGAQPVLLRTVTSSNSATKAQAIPGKIAISPNSRTAVAIDQRVVSGLSRRGVVILDLATGQDTAFIDISGAVNNSSAEVQITADGTRALVVSRGDGSTTAFGYYATIDLTTSPPTLLRTVTSSNSTTKAQAIPGKIAISQSARTAVAIDSRVVSGLSRRGVVILDLATGQDTAFIDISGAVSNASAEVQLTADGSRALVISRGDGSTTAFGYYATIDLTTSPPTLLRTVTSSNSTTKAQAIPGKAALSRAARTAVVIDSRVVSGLSRRGVVILDLATGQDTAFIDISGAVSNASAEVQITADGGRALVISRGDGSTTAFGYYATIDLTTSPPTLLRTVTSSNSTTKAQAIPGAAALSPVARTAAILDQRVVSGLSSRGVVFLDLGTGQDTAFIAISGAVTNSSAEINITNDGTRALAVSRGDGSTTAFGYYATMSLSTSPPTLLRTVTSSNSTTKAQAIPGDVALLPPTSTTPTDLQISMSAAPNPVAVNTDLTYTITVTNAGPGAASDVTVSDALPSGVSFVSATPSAGQCTGTSSVQCALGSLATGASATITLVVRPTVGGELVNTASVTGDQSDPSTLNNSASATVNVLAGPCAGKADGTACDDGNACTQSDTCQAGACQAGTPVTCTASDQCHDAGVCDTATGLCSNPNKADGAPCNDGNACTQSDTCQAGACSGANPVVCFASDQCHMAGSCDTATGLCSNPAKPAGSACGDGTTTACHNPDTCDGAGSCTRNVVSAGTQCRASAGDCDVAESCDGVSNDCPADGFLPMDTQCRAAAGVCDVAESCTGASADCPADGKSTAVCRAAAGECDVADSCDGVNNDCPADARKAAGSACGDDNNACTLDQCDGSSLSCQHPSAADTTPPVFDPFIGDQTVVADGCDGAATFQLPTASDACSNQTSVVCTVGSTAPRVVTSGSVLGFGRVRVDCTATDAANNRSARSFFVTVLQPLFFRLEDPMSYDDYDDDHYRRRHRHRSCHQSRFLFTAGQTVPFEVELLNCQGREVTRSLASSVTVQLNVFEEQYKNGTLLEIDLPESYAGVGAPGGDMVLVGDDFKYNLRTRGYESGTVRNQSFFRAELSVSYSALPDVVAGERSIEMESR